MILDYSKLRGRIKEKFGTEKEFARALNISYATLNKKLNNIYDFSQTEIAKSVRLLMIEEKEISNYFFYIISCENATNL